MSRKILVLCLVAALIAAFMAPAGAAKRKKKKAPKPYTSEEVDIVLSHPVANGQSGSVVGVTAQEFMQNCAIPSSNGLDAWVFEVPGPYRKINARTEAMGTTTGGVYDLDLYYFDKDCELHGAPSNAEGTNETGYMSKGTRYVLMHNYLGEPVTAHLMLKPMK